MSSRQIENEEEQVRADAPSLIDRIFGPGPVSRRWEIAAYLLLIAVAAGLRFWDLGFRAIHHDESLHATYSWYLAVGKGYRHDPMMHGPLLFLLTGLEYYLLGASDYMARVMPALLGTVAVGLPWLLRGRLGRAGALATSGLLTISPGFLYYSRFLREDIFMVVWTLLTVIFMWRYLDDRRPRNLYFLAAALALSFAQKETAFINVAIFGSFLFFMFLTSDARRSKPSDDTPGPDAVAGRLLILIGTLVLPLFIGGVKLVERFSPIRLPGPTDPNAVALFGGILLVVLAVCAVVGHWWNGPLWNRLAILFWAIYVVLYTTFLSNIAGIGTGVVGSLTYWLEQQGVGRGDQPGYYYYILLSLYEFLPVALGIAAIIYYRFKSSVFINFLIYWAALAMVLYSVASEKMPWLSLHIALPLIILSGRLIGDLLSSIPWRRLDPRFYLGVLLSILLLLFLGATVLTWGNRGLEAAQARQEAVGGVLFFLGFVALEIWFLRSQGGRLALKALAVAGLIVLLGLTVRTTLRASFQNGDTPVEMLVYTQTSPDIPVIYKEIEQLSFWKTGGKDLTISVDGASGFSWPWAWYLRDYKNVSYPTLDNPSGPITADVVLVHSSNVDKVRPLLTGYTEGKKYHHRWWFPEESLYKHLTPQKSVAGLFDGASWVQWGKYFFNRDLPESLGPNPLGSEDGYVFFRKDLPAPP